MKIIEIGNWKKEEWTLEVKCEMCGTKLLVDENDLYKRSIMDTKAKLIFFVSFECLHCKKESDIEIYRIPDKIYDNLQEK